MLPHLLPDPCWASELLELYSLFSISRICAEKRQGGTHSGGPRWHLDLKDIYLWPFLSLLEL